MPLKQVKPGFTNYLLRGLTQKIDFLKFKLAKNCIENSKNCNNFHTGSKLERIMPNNTKNRGFKVSKPISPYSFFFRPTVLHDLAASRLVKMFILIENRALFCLAGLTAAKLSDH